jgi:hypothetical protein
MSKIASILAGCAVASMFSLDAQAVPGSPARTRLLVSEVAASEVTLVGGFCEAGFHRSRSRGGCVPNGVTYAGPQTFGLPYVEPPVVRLPYVEGPVARLPYEELPVRVPYAELPVVRLPYAELPPVRLPYVDPPVVRVPYVELPPVRLPY